MSSEIDALLDDARRLAKSPGDDESEEEYWRVVQAIQQRPIQGVFDRCNSWCSSGDPAERRLGADILAQLGCLDHSFPFRSATIPILKRLLADDQTEVVEAALVAFSHLGAQDAIAEIIPFAENAEAELRYAAVLALLTQEDKRAVDTMIRLSQDRDPHVRNWATFGLGAQIDVDTLAVRAALLARVEDPDADTRAEALSGLVKRGDLRVVGPLRLALLSDEVGRLEVEAARDLGSNQLLDALEELRSWWDVDSALLEDAISRCRAG